MLARLVPLAVLAIVAGSAHADDRAPAPMLGPFPSLAAACNAKLRESAPEGGGGRCTALRTRALRGAIRRVTVVQVGERRARADVIALARADGWWIAAVEWTGQIWDGGGGGGNCCDSHSGRPWIQLELVEVDGMEGRAAALMVVTPVWYTGKPGFGSDDPTPEPPAGPSRKKDWGDLTVCGDPPDADVPACSTIQLDHACTEAARVRFDVRNRRPHVACAGAR